MVDFDLLTLKEIVFGNQLIKINLDTVLICVKKCVCVNKKTLARNVQEVEETVIIILHAYSKRPWSVFLPSRHLNVIQIYTKDGLLI